MRVMTFKSVLGFGYNNVRDKTVGRLIELGRHRLLISAYYGLEKINFTPEVLKALGIEITIKKPNRINNKIFKQALIREALSNLSSDVIKLIATRNKQSRDRSKSRSKGINNNIFTTRKSILRNSNQKRK
jgi:hypothetical protein